MPGRVPGCVPGRVPGFAAVMVTEALMGAETFPAHPWPNRRASWPLRSGTCGSWEVRRSIPPPLPQVQCCSPSPCNRHTRASRVVRGRKLMMGTISDLAVVGREKLVTVGGVESVPEPGGAAATVTVKDWGVERGGDPLSVT